MFLQDYVPHHLHPNPYDVYIFLFLAVILVAAVLYGGTKLMNYLDNRKESEQHSGEKDSESLHLKRTGI